MPDHDDPEDDTSTLNDEPDTAPLSPGTTGRTGLVVPEDSEDKSGGTDRERSRAASPLPEEAAAGNDNPLGQAKAILEDSDERQADRGAAPDSIVERRTSDEATAPSD
ncbi:MAG: hypothetical protein NVSMB12_15160 [Acidimicrobiales bacterium]